MKGKVQDFGALDFYQFVAAFGVLLPHAAKFSIKFGFGYATVVLRIDPSRRRCLF